MSNQVFQYTPVSLFKRLMAIIYDLFLLAAVLFISEIVPVVLNHGDAISKQNGPLIFYFLHPVYLLLISYVFLGWFWVHGGQTLGMKTWRIQLKTSTGENLNWQMAATRFIVAIISWCVLGLGFFWSLFDERKRTWHDIASGTVMVQLAKK